MKQKPEFEDSELFTIENNSSIDENDEETPSFVDHSSELGLNYFINNTVKNVVVILVVISFVFLLLSLLSYSSSDPAWSRASIQNADHILNIAGIAGAYTADILYYLFGISIWWLVLYLFITLFNLIISSFVALQKFTFFSYPLSFFSLILALITSPIIASTLYGSHENSLPEGYGGLIGKSLIQVLNPYVNNSIITVIFSLILIVCLIAMMQNTWIQFFIFIYHRIKKSLRKYPNSLPHLRKETAKTTTGQHFLKAKSITQTYVEKPTVAISNRTFSQPKLDFNEHSKSSSNLKKQNNNVVEAEEIHPITSIINPLTEPRKNLSENFKQQLLDLGNTIKTIFQKNNVLVKLISANTTPKFFHFDLKLNQSLYSEPVQLAISELKKQLNNNFIYLEQTNPSKAEFNLLINRHVSEFLSLPLLLNDEAFVTSNVPLLLALGRDINNDLILASLEKMPHFLIATANDDAKNQMLNCIFLSLLTKNTSNQLKFILFGSEKSYLNTFSQLPYVLTSLADKPNKVHNTFAWCQAELEKRLKILAYYQANNIAALNNKIQIAREKNILIADPFCEDLDNPDPLETLPYLVIFFDLTADYPLPIKNSILKSFATAAKNTGIHLIMTVDQARLAEVNTTIKQTFPTRMTFQLNTKLESITMVNHRGAEELTGIDNSLLITPNLRSPMRIQTAIIKTTELNKYLNSYQHKPHYFQEIERFNEIKQEEPIDNLYEIALRKILESKKTSVSYLQRTLNIGYNRANTLLDMMEKEGILSKAELGGKRQILIDNIPSKNKD